MLHNEAAICPDCGHVMERITHIHRGDNPLTRPSKKDANGAEKIYMWHLCHYCTDDCPGGCGWPRMYCECEYQLSMFDQKEKLCLT